MNTVATRLRIISFHRTRLSLNETKSEFRNRLFQSGAHKMTPPNARAEWTQTVSYSFTNVAAQSATNTPNELARRPTRESPNMQRSTVRNYFQMGSPDLVCSR